MTRTTSRMYPPSPDNPRNDDPPVPGGGVVVPVGWNVTDCETGAPVTTREPVPGVAEYPPTGVTVNEYVPFGSRKVIVPLVEEVGVVPSVTVQLVPVGNPVSVNVTVTAAMAVNVIA